MSPMPLLTVLARNWRLAALALVGLVVFGSGYRVASWRYEGKIQRQRAEQLEALQANAKLVAELEQARVSLSESLAREAALKEQEARVVEKVVTQEVIRYVETDNARHCGLSADGVRIHDAAARGELPEAASAASGSDAAAVEATNAEVIRTVVSNYNECNRIRERLMLLQRWADGL